MHTTVNAITAPTALGEGFTRVDTFLSGLFDLIYSNPLQMNVIYALMAAGIYFTYKTKFVQIRMFPDMLKAAFGSRKDAKGGISSFQAFAVGLASRVGTGNIAGVALAIVAGGPGAIFWMWIVATVGMATAFNEAVLAQLFKVRGPGGIFRGGPAYYIRDGLGQRGWGAAFAIFLIFAFGFSFNMVQANTIANVAEAHFNANAWLVGLLLAAITTPIILAGLKPVARIAEVVAPVMALVYLLIAGAIVLVNITEVPAVIAMIFRSAFGLDQAVGGIAGGIFAALSNGLKRGLFSNEAGMGSAPNAAATANIKHPVQQGLVQSLGVFVDTILVCTATACVVLFSGLYKPGMSTNDGAALTVEALSHSLGSWIVLPMVVIIFVFAYSSVLGNYTYAELNWNYLFGVNRSTLGLKLIVIASVFLGSGLSLKAAWSLADIATAFMALLNIFALFLLGKYAMGALRDWQEQKQANPAADPAFNVTNNPHFPQGLPSDVWEH
ncbi:MAG: alanine/glycine:cation symporter family protein [Actinomycetaceae bacterium]|nr:alanine/glycine:cation symporter family protein [Actinomycetaceae bacterium]